MAPLEHQRIPFPGKQNTRDSAVLDCFLSSDETFGAFDRLINTKPAPLEICDLLPFGGAPRFAGSRAHVESLPPEILDLILNDDAIELPDLLALSLTSQTLWVQVAAHIRAIRYNTLGCWVNTPLVITGTYMSKLPPALYQHFPSMREQEAVFAARPNRRIGMCPARRWNYDVIYNFTDVSDSVSCREWTDAFDHHMSVSGLSMVLSCRTRPAGIRDRLRTALTKHLLDPVPLPLGSTWTLRNLTTKECVQLHVEDIDASLARAPHVKGVKGLTVDKILVLQATWKWDSHSWRRDFDGADDFDHDAWAGHCFDIVPCVEAGDAGGGWKDVTESIARMGRLGLDIKQMEKRSSERFQAYVEMIAQARIAQQRSRGPAA